MKKIKCSHCGKFISPNSWIHLGKIDDYICSCGKMTSVVSTAKPKKFPSGKTRKPSGRHEKKIRKLKLRSMRLLAGVELK